MDKRFKETEVGEIPNDWRVKTVRDVATINELTINKSFPHKKIEYIDINSVTEGVISPCQQLSLMHAPSRAKRIVRVNDVIISTVRPNLKHYAFIKTAKPNTIASTGFAVITPKSIDSRFLYYYLITGKYTNYLAAIADSHTSTYPAFNPDVIENSLVPFPQPDEQQAIAKILSDLDDKIELNQQMNQTLEAIGQALFKHWFVDFEFPNENGQPYKSNGGEMESNEELDKEIPKGWEVRRLGDFIHLQRGLSYKGKGLSEHGIPMINLGTMALHHGFLYSGLKFYSGESKERNLVKPGDLVIANTDITQKREVLGSPALVPYDLGSEGILFTHHIYAIRNDSQVHNLFIYYLLQMKEYRDRVKGFATGTTVLALPDDAVLDFEFAVPENDVLTRFVEFIDKSRIKICNNEIQNKMLSKIRDSLLPKLMSGRIRVPVGVR